MNLFNIKMKVKKLLGVVAMGAFIAQSFLPASALAAEPRFNYLPGDSELFRGANASRGDTAWTDPINGNAGDQFKGVVYFHNGIVDSVARNTKIRVSIPGETTNNRAVLNATVSADNAASVTDTLTVNLNEDAELRFVPGSVRFFPNRSQTPEPLPNGANGDAIVSQSGLNIGDINGCWEFAGFATFAFQSVKKAQPVKNIAIEKVVRNVTKNESFKDTTSAYDKDEVEFKVVVKNTGDCALDNVMVKDALPGELSYVANSLKVEGVANTRVNDFFGNGLNLGRINAGASKTITFSTKAPLECKDCTVVNKATAFVGALSVSDTASVKLICKQVNPCPSLNVEKLVRNFTLNEKTFVDENTAKAGDTLEYQIVVRNSGNAPADQVRISDILPLNTQYVSGSTMIARNSESARTWADGIVGNGILIDSIAAGECVTIKFRVIISSKIADNEVLCNTVKVVFGKDTLTDTAKTTIKTTVVPQAAPTKTLPVTGSGAVGGSILTTLLSLGAYGYNRRRKILASQEANIINDLLG